MSQDFSPLQQCINLIEKELGWGNSDNWKTSDFELLSEKIFTKTGVNLSVSTLRRLWGKVKYESAPQISTLNTLARFLDFENFREFTLSLRENRNQTDLANDSISSKSHLKTKEKSLAPKFLLLGIGVVIIALLGWKYLDQSSPVDYDPADFSFSSQPVTSGIPNSVVFEFDVSKARTDSLFIQQSWDSRKRMLIEKTQKKATSIYYYPGFFKAKLILDNEIVREHGLLIPTDGWLPLVVKEPVPVYFEKEEIAKNGIIGLSETELIDANISFTPELPVSSYYYVKDFKGFSSDKFILETKFRNTYAKGAGACQFSQIVIFTASNAFVFSFSIPGCTSDLNVMLSDKMIEGTKYDLSQLGIETTQWADIRVEVKDRVVKLYSESNLVFENSYLEDAGEIMGLGFNFEGTGEIDFVRLIDENDKIILNEEF